jgi:hypothetical protein
MSAISDAIVKDHRELKRYYDEVVHSRDLDHQQKFGNQFVWELARHSIGEELIVYPAMEKYMGARGKSLADEDRQEHHEVHPSPALSHNIKETILTHWENRSRSISKYSKISVLQTQNSFPRSK